MTSDTPANEGSRFGGTWETVLRVVVACLLGGYFVYAGLTKIIGHGPTDFLADVRSFHLLPDPWAAVVAVGLPVLEVVAGLSVILGWKRRAGALLIAFMLLVFIAGLASAAYRGIDVSCGCFGKTEGATDISAGIQRDVLLLLAAVYFVWRPNSKATA